MERKFKFLRFIICVLLTAIFAVSVYLLPQNIAPQDNQFTFIVYMSLLGFLTSLLLVYLYKKNIILIVCKRELKKKHPEVNLSLITLKNFSHIKEPLTNSQYITLDSLKNSVFFEAEITTFYGGYIKENLIYYSFDANDGYLVFISTPYFVKGQIISVDQPRVQKIFRFKNGKTYILSFSQRIKSE